MPCHRRSGGASTILHWASFCIVKNGTSRHHRHQPRPVVQSEASGRPVFWPQNYVRRCAIAMKDSGSRDWYQLAREVLEGLKERMLRERLWQTALAFGR
jgi:hypothetical protein